MGNLLTSLLNVTNSMRVAQRTLGVIQNNVTNASTPGYVRQTQTLVARSFQVEGGLTGGVAPGDLVSARAQYAEEAVWRHQHGFGFFAQKHADLAQLEPALTVADKAGIAGAMNDFFRSISALTVSPNDSTARQSALDSAAEVARSFNNTAVAIANSSAAGSRELSNVGNRVSRLAEEIRAINIDRRRNFEASKDSGTDARLHVALEQLAELVDFSTLQQPDGSVTVLVGGQTPLVLGDHVYPLSADFSGAAPRIRDADGRDITGQLSGGRLRALLDFTGDLAPGLLQKLDTLAQSFAENVNGILASGVTLSGAPPQPLFVTDTAIGAARTMRVPPMDPGDLALAAAGAPGGNANAILLARLSTAKLMSSGNSTYTFAEFYGNIAGTAGHELTDATANEGIQEQLVLQARAFRSDISSVSLDEEAAQLIEVQRTYEAAAKMAAVLNEMTETVLNLI
jgi:flagellar hook-associated protein 1 FlgK